MHVDVITLSSYPVSFRIPDTGEICGLRPQYENRVPDNPEPCTLTIDQIVNLRQLARISRDSPVGSLDLAYPVDAFSD